MPFEKTITLPEDASAAQSAFQDALQQDWILIVALHDGPEALSFVGLADASAGSPGEPYRVIWSKAPSAIRDIVESLTNGEAVGANLAGTRGFSVSRNGKVCDVIGMQDTADEARVELAWTLAEEEG